MAKKKKGGKRKTKISLESITSSNVYYLEIQDIEKEEKKEGTTEDVDESSTKESKRKMPHWTRSTDDEETKYTDWTLDLNFSTTTTTTINDDDNASDVVSYSVHRYPLGLQSEYFDGIFRSSDEGGFSESHQKRSVIKLPTPFVTIYHFEKLLDYLYTGKLVLESDNAVAMLYFGDYFGIGPLKELAQKFIGKSIAVATASACIFNPSTTSSKLLAKYYQDASGLAMESLQEAIVYKCASQPTLMSKDTALSKIPDKQFWLSVFAAKKYQVQTELSNKLWSLNAVHFIELHSKIISPENFLELTQKDSLPIVSAKAAIILMEQEQRLLCVHEEVENNIDEKHLTCLQQRCIDSLVDNETGDWKVSSPRTLLQGKLRNLNPFVLETLMLQLIDDRKQPNKCSDYIEILGAGTECVNGIYIKSGLRAGCPMYTRKGAYNGENVLFHIYRYDDEYDENEYYISIIKNPVVESTPDFHFYLSPHTEVEGIPDDGWVTYGEGQDPVPILRFVDV